MTELVYQVGNVYTTLYSEAVKLEEQLHTPKKRIYRPVEEYTQAQKDAFKAHAAKAAAYRKEHKNS